eukprot:3917708-Rhodomonas_salina.5
MKCHGRVPYVADLDTNVHLEPLGTAFLGFWSQAEQLLAAFVPFALNEIVKLARVRILCKPGIKNTISGSDFGSDSSEIAICVQSVWCKRLPGYRATAPNCQ